MGFKQGNNIGVATRFKAGQSGNPREHDYERFTL